MRFPTARRLALAALLPALLVFSVVPGCSNESEGERCGDDPNDPSQPGALNDDDCSSPLVCTAAAKLIASQANRCCDPNPAIVNDSRCLPRTGSATTDAGIDGAAGASDTDATASAGAPGAGGGSN